MNEIVQDAIGNIFVKDTFIAKFLQVEFEALELYAFHIGNIAKGQCSKVRLARFWAHGGEFRAYDLDMVFTVWKRVIKTLEFFLKWGTWHSFPPSNELFPIFC